MQRFVRSAVFCSENKNKRLGRMNSCLPLVLALCSTTAAIAQAPQLANKKTIEAVRIRENITLDGALDEPAWQSAVEATDFLFFGPTRAGRRPNAPCGYRA